MVHTWLAVFGRVDGIPFSKLDLALLFEVPELPPDEGVIERVDISGDEGATPVHL